VFHHTLCLKFIGSNCSFFKYERYHNFYFVQLLCNWVPIIYAQYLYWYWYLKVTYWYWYWYWYLLVEYLIQDWRLLEQPISTNSVPCSFFPRVAIGCRLSLKIDRNLEGSLSVATWYDSAWIGGMASVIEYLIQICGYTRLS